LKNFRILLAIYFLLASQFYPQINTVLFEFGKFSDAVSVSINDAGFVFVADAGKNEIVKFDTLGKELATIGGYGWGINQFDRPADVFASTLNVYVADENNSRIVFYDKDLNFISQLKGTEISEEENAFGYPLACGVSNRGDLFVLDSDNGRIIKYDLDGRFLAIIGAEDAGSFALVNPVAFALSPKGKLFVADGTNICVYDFFGNGLFKFDVGEEVKNLNFSRKYLLVVLKGKLKIFRFTKQATPVGEVNVASYGELRDAQIFNGKIYLLFPTVIRVINLAEETIR